MMCIVGVNPEALAHVVKELRREADARASNVEGDVHPSAFELALSSRDDVK